MGAVWNIALELSLIVVTDVVAPHSLSSPVRT